MCACARVPLLQQTDSYIISAILRDGQVQVYMCICMCMCGRFDQKKPPKPATGPRTVPCLHKVISVNPGPVCD